MIKVTMMSYETNQNLCHLINAMRIQHHFYDVAAKEVRTDSYFEGPSDKNNLKDILYVTCSVTFNIVKVMKVKGRLENCSRLKVSTEV